MTAKELIDDLALLGPQPLNVVFEFVAERIPELRTKSGSRLTDASNFAEILREMADQARQEIWRDEARQ